MNGRLRGHRRAVSQLLLELLRDPDAHQRVFLSPSGQLVTQDGQRTYPVRDGVPTLLSADSVFSDRLNQALRRGRVRERPAVASLRLLRQVLPSVVASPRSRANYKRLVRLLRERAEGSGVQTLLVIGGSIDGVGFDEVRLAPHIDVLATDVALGPRTDVICDAHHLPFPDEAFDAAVTQAVLEHVLDPNRVVSELFRVMKPGALIYSEVPFLQPVHEGAFDFTRYTLGGHRRLLRKFEEIDAGPASGPGSTLAWSARSFALAAGGRARSARLILGGIANLLTFWFKYFDFWLIRAPGGADAACSTFFLGRKGLRPTPDEVIISRYQGVGSDFQAHRGGYCTE